MGRRSSGPPTPRVLRGSSRPDVATMPPPAEYDPDAPPPSRRATEPPVAGYKSIRESCSSFAVEPATSLDDAAAGSLDAALADDSHLVFRAVLTGDDLDWFPLSEASLLVVGTLDGRRSTREVATLLAMDVAETCKIARDLLSHGIIALHFGE